MRKAAILASVLAVSACAYPNPQHVAALNALIGKQEADLIRAEGVPSRTYEAGGHKFLAYSRSRIESIPGSPGFGGYGYGPILGAAAGVAAGEAGAAAFRPTSSSGIAKPPSNSPMASCCTGVFAATPARS